jgi:hypothetical protein
VTDRDTILARRRLLMVSALAGLAVTSCEKASQPCLSIAWVSDGGEPQTCLKPHLPPDPSAKADAAAAAAKPCLEAPPPSK